MLRRPCPTPDELRCYALGDTNEDIAGRIEEHLADCPACEETLAKFDSADDTLVRHLPLAADAAQEPPEDWLDRLREDISQLTSDAEAPAGDEHARTDEVGREFLGSYRLLARIGRGGMGVVYRAWHTQLDRAAAVKVLSPHLVASAAARARFDREIQIVGRLDHPGIVRAADAGRVGRTAYLVMEYVDGVDLARIVRSGGPLPVSEACEAARQVAEALAAAHRRAAIHRDVKPSNLMVDRQGQVKLLDFGLARLSAEAAAEQHSTQGRLLGTLEYMAPEQAGSGHPVDHRADLYGLGATLFFLLTGKSPRSDCGQLPLLVQLQRIAENDPPRATELRPDVPAELDELIARLLARPPEDRPASGEEVAALLAQFAGGNLAGRVAEIAPPQADPRREDAEEVAQAEASLAEQLGEETTEAESPPVKSAPERTPSSSRRFGALPRIAMAAALLFVACLGVVLILQTPDGTLRIESEAENIRVELVNDQGQVRSLEIQKGDKETVLRAGRYRVRLAGAHDSLEVTPDEFTLRAGDNVVARIRYERAQLSFRWPKDAPPLAVAPFDAEQAKQHQQAWADYLGIKVEVTNSVGAKMVLIPPGEFMMGSTDEQVAAALKLIKEWGSTDPKTLDDTRNAEHPQHKVVITRPFLISATEVTNRQFRKFVEATRYVSEGRTEARAERAPADAPKESITWKDATAYCNWLSEQEATRYRLPTEAEWEYACRAGTTTQYSFGDDHTRLASFGWSHGGWQHPVGTKLPNAFGLYDMHGNVYEWCGDYWDGKWYEKTSSIDPTGPASGSEHVVRGGAFHSGAPTARSAFRHHIPSRRAYGVVGFRCVQVLDLPSQPPIVALRSESLATSLPDSGEWIVIFRSSDPKIWNADVDDGPDRFAIPWSRVPEGIKYLRMRIEPEKFVIIEVTKGQLGMRSDNGRIGWVGNNLLQWNGRHLGIYNRRWTDEVRGTVHIWPMSNRGIRGWGFGNRAKLDDGQAYSWAGQSLPKKTVFEIAVKSGPLTADEEKALLK